MDLSFLSFDSLAPLLQSPYMVAALLIAVLSALFLYFFPKLSTVVRISVWFVTIAAVGACIVFAAILSNSTTQLERRVTPQLFIEGRGFYEDIENMPDGLPVIFRPSHEDLRLAVYSDNFIDGQSGGTVVQGSELSATDKIWRQSGYISGDMVFLSYTTTHNDQQPAISPGIGAYILQHQGQNYVGRLMFWDSRFRVTLDCPYLLATGQTERRLSDEAAMERWPFLRGGCRQVSFSP